MPEVPGVEHRFVEANGVRIHVAEAGSGEPLVLLHGWPQHWYEWREVIGPLSETRRVICPDLRGFGWSSTPGSGFGPPAFAEDLLALMDAEGIERFDMIGHDWGGYTGFLIGLSNPSRLRRLIALNIIPPFTPITARAAAGIWRFWYQWAVAAPGAGPLIARSLAARRGPIARISEWLGAGEGVWDAETRQVFMGQFSDRARARATTGLYRACQREIFDGVRGRWRNARLAVPTRIIFGTGDKVLDYRALEGVERFGDDLEVELVPGVGHLIADERPELIVERARSWLIDRGHD